MQVPKQLQIGHISGFKTVVTDSIDSAMVSTDRARKKSAKRSCTKTHIRGHNLFRVVETTSEGGNGGG